MTKLSFQFPTGKLGDFELSEESKVNASFAMLGVVAIIAIISLVFLFQHVLVAPGFGEAGAYVVYETVGDAKNACDFPGDVFVPDNTIANFLKEKQGYNCEHKSKGFWCCAQ